MSVIQHLHSPGAQPRMAILQQKAADSLLLKQATEPQHVLLSDTGKVQVPQTNGACRRAASKQLELVVVDTHPAARRTTRKMDGGGGEQLPLPEAVEALTLLVQQGSYVDDSTIYSILKRCISSKNLALGTRVHALALQSGYEAHPFLANHFICMYASHGRLEQASQVFTKVPSPNCYMWASIILGHARQQQPRQALQLYCRMRASGGVKPNAHIFLAALKACAAARDLALGKQVHAHILQAATLSSSSSAGLVVVGTSLVDMYAKCGSLEDARAVFDDLPAKDVVTWNAMLTGYVQHGDGDKALALYADMQQRQGNGATTRPNRVTFVCLLQACAAIGALQQGKQLHAQVEESGLLLDDVALGNCLVTMYAKCGSLEDARRVFDGLATKDVVSWNSMIKAYAGTAAAAQEQQHGHEALALYSRMQQQQQQGGGAPAADAVTFLCLLQACATVGALHQGVQLHAHIRQRGLLQDDVALGNALVNMYAKCGSLDKAREVFDGMPAKDVVSWATMIAGYAQEQGRGQDALALYARMKEEEGQPSPPPNHVTFLSLLQACASTGDLQQGQQLHAEIQQRGLDIHTAVANCLVDMYAKCGSLEQARQVFDKLGVKDVVTWNAMIAGYAQHGRGQQALDVYGIMQQQEEDGSSTPANSFTFIALLQACASTGGLCQGKELHRQIQERGMESEPLVGNSLINMYAKCGSVADAWLVFTRMQVKTVATWNAMIGGYEQNGMGEEALALFYGSMQQQRQGQPTPPPPNAVTYVCLLQACASVAGLDRGRQLHQQIVDSGLHITDLCVTNALVDMYSKCGSMADAQQLFDSVSPTVRDVVTWNTLIAGYARQGECDQVFAIFQRMTLEKTVEPNGITFLCLLTACSHLGLVDKCLACFQRMCRDYSIAPAVEHYTCVVDLLGRAGQLDKAVELVETMPLQPTAAVWKCLLSACQKWGDVGVARTAFQGAVSADRHDPAPYVLMANVCVAAGREDEAREVQALRVQVQAWKQPGQSWWTEVEGTVHTFSAQEWGHPEIGRIQAVLRDVFLKCMENEA